MKLKKFIYFILWYKLKKIYTERNSVGFSRFDIYTVFHIHGAFPVTYIRFAWWYIQLDWKPRGENRLTN